MNDFDTTSRNSASNSTDFLPVYIYFEDEDINQVFAELLEARGVHAEILADPADAKQDTKIITEPRYFPQLPESCQRRCLVVGNKDAAERLPALALTRPLTEEKIETALRQFLRS